MKVTMKVAVIFLLMAVSKVSAWQLTDTQTGLRGGINKNSLPDPTCRSGIISLPLIPSKKQVCCPGYCGECSDYATCANVRGQKSEKACCASEVLGMECGFGAPANVCLKKCTESLPPCIMHGGLVQLGKAPTDNAAKDCGGAVEEWRLKAAAAMKTTTTQAPTQAPTRPPWICWFKSGDLCFPIGSGKYNADRWAAEKVLPRCLAWCAMVSGAAFCDDWGAGELVTDAPFKGGRLNLCANLHPCGDWRWHRREPCDYSEGEGTPTCGGTPCRGNINTLS